MELTTMTQDPQNIPPVFHIDVSSESSPKSGDGKQDPTELMIGLMRQILATQQRQTQLLEEMVQYSGEAQKQRATELGHWKEANPNLAKACRSAAETLSRVQTEFLRNITDEITDNEEHLVDGDFMLNEFVDRYGPRLAHLNGVLQVLSQLSSPTTT